MSNSTNNVKSGRPAVATTASGSGATQFIAMSPTPGSGPNNEAPTARGFNPGQAGPSGHQATQFFAMPSTPGSSRAEPTRGRGRYPTSTHNHPRPSAPRRMPQQPKLSKTYQEGGQVLPNSRAELEAYGKAMEEYVKDLTTFNESKPPRSHRGSKRSHHGPSGNGNNYFIQDNDPQRRERARSPSGSQLPRNSTSATPIGQALLNTVSQTQQPTVSTTLRRELNDDFLRDFNSSTHLEQLDTIRRLDREIHDHRTSNARHADIAAILWKFEIVDPVGAPPAKRQAMASNGKPTVEVLYLYSSTKEQLSLTQTDFACIMSKVAACIEKLPKCDAGSYPEWNYASWNSKHRGHIAVASEDQAVLVTALINSVRVPGVPFRLWRAHEVEELTQVKIVLDGGYLQSWTEEMVMTGLFTRNPLKGSYSEYINKVEGKTGHVVLFKANAMLRASLASLQNGSSTFHLLLAGQERKAIMARDPLVVAAEGAAALRSRIERALAKARASSRPDLGSAGPDEHEQQQGPVGVDEPEGETDFERVFRLHEDRKRQREQQQQQLEVPVPIRQPDHDHDQQQRLAEQQQQQVEQFRQQQQQHLLQQQQQQGQGNKSTENHNTQNPNQNYFSDTGPANVGAPETAPPRGAESDVVEALRQVDEKRQLALQHQQQRQQRQQQQQQHQEQQQGNKITGNINNLGPNRVSSPNPGYRDGYTAWLAAQESKATLATQSVASRVRMLNTSTSPPGASSGCTSRAGAWAHAPDGSSPPAGHDMAALSGGLPWEPLTSAEVWANAPPVTSELEYSPPLPPAPGLPKANHDLSPSSSSSNTSIRTVTKAGANTSTGSTKVDDLAFDLGDTSMEQDQESDLEIYDLANEDNEMAMGDPPT
jgi:hypothetical protein